MKAKATKKQLIEKNKMKSIVIGVLTTVLAFSAVLGGARIVLANTDTGMEQKINEAVVLYALQNPESEMAMVLAKFVLVSEQKVLAGLEKEHEMAIGVVTDQENQVRTERVCTQFSDSDFKYECVGWGRITLPSTTTTASEVNRLGRDAIVDHAEVELTGTVSSSLYMYVGTASSTYVGYANGAGGLYPRPDNLIDGYNFVTSTVAVDSPDRIDTYRNIINSINDAGTLGVNTVPFTSSSAMVVFMQNQVSGTAGLCPGEACEAVTSTNRGYSGFLKYRFRYEIDL